DAHHVGGSAKGFIVRNGDQSSEHSDCHIVLQREGARGIRPLTRLGPLLKWILTICVRSNCLTLTGANRYRSRVAHVNRMDGQTENDIRQLNMPAFLKELSTLWI